jgi:hypothetical protein
MLPRRDYVVDHLVGAGARDRHRVEEGYVRVGVLKAPQHGSGDGSGAWAGGAAGSSNWAELHVHM